MRGFRKAVGEKSSQGFESSTLRIKNFYAFFGIEIFNITSREFIADVPAFESNVSGLDMITHSIQSLSTTRITSGQGGESINPHEILTPFGIFELDYGDTRFFRSLFGNLNYPIFELKPIFGNPTTQIGSFIPVDYQKSGFDDLILLSSTHLYYIEDLQVNLPPTIGAVRLDPCLDEGAIAVNTTLNIIVPLDDGENDNVRAKIITYAGTLDETDTGFSEFLSDQNPRNFQFSVLLDVIAPTAVLSIFGQDDTSAFENSRNESYTVAENGLTTGDCIQILDITPPVGILPPEFAPPTTTLEDGATNTEDNAIVNAIDELVGLTGIGRQVFWLIFMFIAGLSIFVAGISRPNVNLAMCFGVFLVIETLLLIIGFLLGFFGFGTLLTIVVIAIAILGVMFARFFTGTD